ncbi:MAG: hypothetical protein ABR612_13125 [Chromatocurvus sp.]
MDAKGDKEPLIRLVWNGAATTAEIAELLDLAEQIEITLPANYNHALFRTLHPDAPVSALEDLDTRAGPELLADIATVRGLENLAALTDTLIDAQATLHLLSPPTLLIDLSARASPSE